MRITTRGNRTRITHPGGAFFEYHYDTADRLFRLSENGLTIMLATIEFDGQRRRDWLARDAGAITDYDYDPISRLEVLTHDLDGTDTAANDAGFGFLYNPASQITTRAQINEAYEFPFTPAVEGYTVDGRNQYTQVGGTTHTWDANGNLKDDGPTTYGYDTENRLVSAGAAALKYDPLGRLYEVSIPAGSTTRFVYDGDRLIAEYSGAGALQRRYVHGSGVDKPLVWYETDAVSAATRRYLHADHQGSIVAVSSATGAKIQVHAYDAYGVTATDNTLRFQYTGQAAIPEVGLLYYKARFYNPALGRFMQTDPIGYEDDNNLYAYVGNDPLNMFDPTGMAGCADMGGQGLSGKCFDASSFDEARDGSNTTVATADVDAAAVSIAPSLENTKEERGTTIDRGEDGTLQAGNTSEGERTSTGQQTSVVPNEQTEAVIHSHPNNSEYGIEPVGRRDNDYLVFYKIEGNYSCVTVSSEFSTADLREANCRLGAPITRLSEHGLNCG